MKRVTTILMAAALLAGLTAIPAKAVPFGFERLDVTFTEPDGSPAMQAGSHPFAQTVTIDLNTEVDPKLGKISSGQARSLTGELPVGFVGSPTATPRCSGVEFATRIEIPEGPTLPSCSESTVVGVVVVRVFLASPITVATPVYNLVPPPGVAAKLGFLAEGSPVAIELGAKENPPYNLNFRVENITQMIRFYGSTLTLWGNPSDPIHDEERGACGTALFSGSGESEEGNKYFPGKKCQTSNPNIPFLTMPRSCTGPLPFSFDALAWNTGAKASGLVETHDSSVPPSPLGMSGCERLGFAPHISVQPNSRSAESPTGLDVDLEVKDEGLTDTEGIANSDLQKAIVTLPEGVTINPSQAEGLAVCSEAEFDREKPASPFGAGCPSASKIGSVEVETPLLEGTILHGSLFVAEPYENRFGSLIALFMTVKDPELGLVFKLAGKVEPDPRTGKLVTTFDQLPQYPFSHFHLHFREGGRSPLVTPPRCGTYLTRAQFFPTGEPSKPLNTTASFEINSGVGGGPCPSGGVPPFKPGFTAGAINNDAGSYSPYYMRLTRQDGEQDMTKFSAILPPGVVGKIAGVEKCPESQIAIARAKSGIEELSSPSCPANSKIGRLMTAAGVGAALTHVPGSLYLAGPYHGDPLSIVAVVPAVAGPFDAGDVVVRVALNLNPKTAEVEVDGASSDPIPHILKGIVLKVREVEVFVDRDQFTINPTSCAPSQTRASIFGAYLDVFNSADDLPVALSSRYQAADCASLGFKPRLNLKLKGGTKRGGHPGLTANYTPRAGDANVKGLVVRLPRSAFLDQAHIRTICTRVQFAADACPKGAQYGYIKAFTPLLDEPLQGPVYLRSSNHKLPDLVFDLHGLVDVEVATRIDSVKGGIRARVEDAPDAPLSKVVLQMQGAQKGLIINSRDLCGAPARANVEFSGHNGKESTSKPVMKAECGGKRKGSHAGS